MAQSKAPETAVLARIEATVTLGGPTAAVSIVAPSARLDLS